MIYEHFVHGGWIGFDTRFVEELGKRIPRLGIGINQKDGKTKVYCVLLIHKNTEILPSLHKAIGHYLEQRNGVDIPNKTTVETLEKTDAGKDLHRVSDVTGLGIENAYFQHEQETSTG